MSTYFSKVRHQVRYFPKSVKLVWAAAPGWSAAWLFLIVVQGILPVATVYLTKLLVDSLSIAFGSSNGASDAKSLAIFYLLIMAAVMLLAALLKALMQWVQAAQAEFVQDFVKDRVHAQAIRLDLSYYESANYYDMLQRASVDAVNRPLSLVQGVGSLGQSLITLLAMLGILATYHPLLPIVLTLCSLPALFVALKYAREFNHVRLKRTSQFRRAQYFSSVITERESAAEMRLFSLGGYFRKSYKVTRQLLRVEQVSLARRHAIAEFIAALIGLMAMVGALAWSALSMMASKGSFGDLALIYQAFSQGQRLMQTLLSNVRQLYMNLLFVENLFAFLDLQPILLEPLEPTDKVRMVNNEIQLRDVSFTYPGSDRPSLRHFNLSLPVGKTIAIVGENGAGKSTLIKLLTRLYDPQTGSITIDNEDIKNWPLAEVRRLFTALFQEPVHFHQSVSDNITLAQWWTEYEEREITAAAVGSGADSAINRLPNSYQTVLGKYFGGAELSGGEWQRIALARAFIRKAQFVLLDEPTSAMDSWAESDWMERFDNLVGSSTALLITHRFTTAMHADIIHVMESGCVIESGTHAELLQLNGRYAESWLRQMKAANLKS